METDLLVNPSMVNGGMANIETIDLPTLNFEEFSGGSSAPAAPACAPCAAGTYQTASGATDCTSCPAGTFALTQVITV